MADERRLIITLEVNAKGELTIKKVADELGALEVAQDRVRQSTTKLREEDAKTTAAQESSAKTTGRRVKIINDEADAVDKATKTTRGKKVVEVEATDALDKSTKKIVEKTKVDKDAAAANAQVVKTGKERAKNEKEQTTAVDATTAAVGRGRDATGRFTAGAGGYSRSLRGLTADQQGLTSAIAIGVVKAQAFVAAFRGIVSLGSNLITAPIKALSSGIVDLIEDTVTATEKFDRFRITIEGALKSASRAREITGFVQEFGLRSPVRVEEIQDLTKSIALIPSLKSTFFGDFNQVKNDLEDLYGTVIGLASLNPQQGIPGAVFAIREALAGQFRSLRARFDIMPEIVAGSIGKTIAQIKKSPKDVIAALKAFVDQSVGGDTLTALGRLPSVRIGNIKEALTQIAPRQIGTAGLQDFISEIVGRLDDSLQAFFTSGGPFEQNYAPRISERLQGIMLQGLRIVGSLFGGADSAIGGNGVPTIERVAQTMESVLKKAEDALTGIADRLVEKRQNITTFFGSIFDALKTGFDAFTGFLKSLPDYLPIIGAFVNGLVTIVSKVITGLSKIGTFLGYIGNSAIVQTLSPDSAQQLRIAGLSQGFSDTVTAQARARFKGPEGEFPAFLGDQFKRATEALQDLAAQGRPDDDVRRSDPGFRDPSRSAFRSFFSKEIAGSGGSSIRQLVSLLAANDTNFDTGPRLAKRLSESGASTVDLLRATIELKKSNDDLVVSQKKIIETNKEQAKPTGGQKTPPRFDPSTNEFVSSLGLPGELTNFLGGPIESRSPISFEAERRSAAEISSRIPSEFTGTVSAITDLGNQAREKLGKLLLDPLEQADEEFRIANEAFTDSIEKLAVSVELETQGNKERVAKALSLVAEEIAKGVISPEQGARARAGIVLTGVTNAFNIAEVSGGARGAAGTARSDSILAGLQSTLQTLFKTDTEDRQQLERVLTAVEARISVAQPTLGDDKQERTIGSEGARGLAGFALRSRTAALGSAGSVAGLLPGSPEAELRTLNDQLKALQTRSDLEERIRGIVNDRAVTEKERSLFEETFTRDQERQVEALKFQVAAKQLTLNISKEEESLQRTLSRETDPGRRYALVSQALGQVESQIASIGALLAGDSGERLAALLGVADPAKAAALARAGLETLEARKKALSDLRDQTDPNEAIRRQLAGVRPGDTVSTGQLFGALSEDDKQRLESEYGVLGTKLGIAFTDHFGLATAEHGKLRIKQFGELVNEGTVTFALKAADSLQSSFGDAFYKVFTGDFASIQDVWNSFLQSLLRAFSDFIAELAIKAAFGKAISQLFSALGGAAGGGGLDGAVSADIGQQYNVAGIGAPQFAEGGIVGPGAGGAQTFVAGEGSSREGIIPLLTDDSIPVGMRGGQLVALLPGGRTIPMSFTGYANGGIAPQPGPAVSFPKMEPVTVVIVNQLDSAAVVAAGLPANAQFIDNRVAGDFRNRGPASKAARRYNRG